MKILAIDTSNQPLSVAVLENQNLLATKTVNISRNHSTTLMPMVAQLLKECHLKPAAIDRFVVAEGPGSYTGLRIGVTAAKTLASTLNKELIGVSSLKTVAANLAPCGSKVIVPYFDARNLNVFAGAYQWQDGQLETVIADHHCSFKNLIAELKDLKQEIVFVGPEKDEFIEMSHELFGDDAVFASADYQMPQAAILGRLGASMSPVDADSFVPKYQRLTQAELQWMEKHPEESQNHASFIEKV